MKKLIILPSLLAVGMALCVYAQSDAEYQGLMKNLAKTSGMARKAVMEKNGSEAATAGEQLEGIYKQVTEFWQKRGTQDAVEISKKGETGAHELMEAGKANDDAKMASSMQMINGTCGACHMAHRGGSGGAFTIK